jgi:hypothetical protein
MSHSHPEVSLEGCYERIVRAREHLHTLNDEILKYLGSPSCEAVMQEPDVENRSQVADLTILKDPPQRWGIVLGEAGYDLRSSLDHLVYQLAIWKHSDPDQDRTQFPIFLKGSEYTRRRGKRPSERDRMLRGVSRKHRRMIDQLQPYQHGRMAERTALALLAWFSNKDKHRVTHQPIVTIHGVRLRVIQRDLSATEVYLSYEGQPQVMKEEGPTHQLRFRFRTPPNVGVNVEASALKVGVGFGDRLLQTPDFFWVADKVESVIQRFVPTIQQ